MKIVPANLLFLGTGGSMGIPVLGCHCEVCRSKDPHNKRMRPSALMTFENKNILIDCGPDFHYQALKYNIDALDGVILTHAHYDHTAGIDELRAFIMRSHKSLPCLLCPETAGDIKRRFYYIFDKEDKDKLTTKFDLHLLEEQQGVTEFLGLRVGYTSFEQAGMRVNGFRFGDLAYISDIRNFDESIYQQLQGLDVLIISALRFEPSPLHFSVDEAVAFSKRCGVKHTWLTHIAHELDHEKVNAYLPENIRMGYDGLEISFKAEIF